VTAFWDAAVDYRFVFLLGAFVLAAYAAYGATKK
jgi:hypothetical protein